MATIKSYTDIEQSKKLATILPLESADMGYLWNGTSFCNYPVSNQTIFKRVENIPCWSLDALLGILPKEYTNSKNQVCTLHIDIVDSETPYLMWYANPEHEGSIVEIKTKEYSNLIDACYEMVLKLHESNML